MKIDKVTTPVLLKKDHQVLRLLNITYESDNSIYITFPRKNSYTLNKIDEKEWEKTYEIVEVSRTLHNTEEEFNVPKISFHPRNNTMHMKSADGKRVNAEYLLHNFSDDKTLLLIPFVQIIFPPNYEIFDEYKKDKYKDKIEIEDIIDWDKEVISLEIFIHTQNSTITEEALPYFKNRNFKYVVSYFGDHKYSCSVVIATIPKGAETSNIIIAANTEEYGILYSLDPIGVID